MRVIFSSVTTHEYFCLSNINKEGLSVRVLWHCISQHAGCQQDSILVTRYVTSLLPPDFLLSSYSLSLFLSYPNTPFNFPNKILYSFTKSIRVLIVLHSIIRNDDLCIYELEQHMQHSTQFNSNTYVLLQCTDIFASLLII